MASDCIDWLIPIILPCILSGARLDIKFAHKGHAIPPITTQKHRIIKTPTILFGKATIPQRKVNNIKETSKIFIEENLFIKILLITPDPIAQQIPIKAAKSPIEEFVNANFLITKIGVN